jgi:serine/threonine protein phosphatase PrpC
MSVLIFGQTDIGKKRTNNEDSYLCYSFEDFSEPNYLIAVADGMGGHRAGEIASSLAIESIKKRLIAQYKERTVVDSDFFDILEDSIQEANSKVFSQASQSNELTGMGSTLVAALLSRNQAAVCNVGDSRAYLIRQKQIEQITTDHNWKSEQIQLGELNEDDIKDSPYKDLITRSLGLNAETEIDSFPVEVCPEDYLLLCSDGLHSLVTSKEILKTFRKFKNPEAICQKLIEAANKKGGNDNITVVVAHFTGQETMDGDKASFSDTVNSDCS